MFRFQSADTTHTWRLRTESGEPHCRFFHVFTLNAVFSCRFLLSFEVISDKIFIFNL